MAPAAGAHSAAAAAMAICSNATYANRIDNPGACGDRLVLCCVRRRSSGSGAAHNPSAANSPGDDGSAMCTYALHAPPPPPHPRAVHAAAQPR
jgi:hypothetical protein